MNFKKIEDHGVERHYFDVSGAGQLQFGTSPKARCGGAIGFTVGASWGRHGLVGGVIDREDAKALADMIYESLKTA